MKALNRLISLLPIVAIALVSGQMVVHWYRTQSQARPDYENPTPTASPVLAPEPRQSATAQVVSVHDGDTMRVILNGREERIRFCGIDAPELDQPGGTASRDYLRSRVASARNQVTLVVTDRDRYGRWVAEVFVMAPTADQPEGESLLNYELVAAGHAYVYPQYISGCPNGGAIAQGEVTAQGQQVGVWGSPGAVKPWDYRRSQ